MTTSTKTVVNSAPLTDEQAWNLWRSKGRECHRDVWFMLRESVMEHVKADRPGLEEIGSSDLNHYAVSYIKSGELVFLDDTPLWEWRS